MSEDLDSISEEERSLFRPFTRDSLAAIEARIAEEHAKQKELEKKRAEGEVIIKLVVLHSTLTLSHKCFESTLKIMKSFHNTKILFTFTTFRIVNF